MRFRPTAAGLGASACVTSTSALGEQQLNVLSWTEIESTNHPTATEVFTPVPQTHLSWTFWPAAAPGRLTSVVTHPLELAPHAGAPAKGLPVPVDKVQLYPPVIKPPPAARISEKAPPPIEI